MGEIEEKETCEYVVNKSVWLIMYKTCMRVCKAKDLEEAKVLLDWKEKIGVRISKANRSRLSNDVSVVF